VKNLLLFAVCFVMSAGVTAGLSTAALASIQLGSEQGVGSCYEVKPICIGGGHPVCMCTVTMQCYWVCK
jgi:hypothetical protein